MEDVLDLPRTEAHEENVKYGGFWPRLGALIIDALVMLPVSFGMYYLNITSWKSSMILVMVTVVTTAYKPVMECVYGATLGKMAFDLRVVNVKLETATLTEVLLRNIFHITPSVLTLLLTMSLYQLPEFEAVSGYGEYTAFVGSNNLLQIINLLSGAIFIADTIVMLADPQNRSWHDKIGGTCVIEKKRPAAE